MGLTRALVHVIIGARIPPGRPSGSLEFRLLGPLEAWRAARQLPLGGERQRALLALLLLDANDVRDGHPRQQSLSYALSGGDACFARFDHDR